ncbi:MAG: porin family protein [Tannerellaceae bacterium]|nr:porin family protein [Tannerellaceae bacterium]
MKSYLIVFAAVMVCVTAVNAQGNSVKPEAGSFALEAGFSPFAIDGNNINLQEGQIKAIYTVTDQISVRLGLGINANSDISDNGQTGDGWEELSMKSSQISISPGIIVNMEGTSKMTPYLGAEVIFATTSTTLTEEGNNYKVVMKNVTEDGDLSFNTIGLGVFGGFNYYFAQKLYAGAEIGLSFRSNTWKNAMMETTNSGVTETVELKDSQSRTSFGTAFKPAIRLGWVF